MPPRKKEDKVGSWLSSSRDLDQEDPYDSEADDMAPTTTTQQGQSESSLKPQPPATQQWDTYLQETTRAAFSASTRQRTEAWEHLASVIESEDEPLSSDNLVDVVALALETAPRYTDRSSRIIVIQVLRAALTKEGASDSSALLYAVAHLKKQVDQAAKVSSAGTFASALSIRISLLSFVLATFSAFASLKDATSSKVWPPLVQTMALAFDAVVGEQSPKARSNIRNVLVLARRSVRESHAVIPQLIETITSSPPANAIRSTALLGLICDVCLRLRVGSETSKGAEDGVGRTLLRSKKDAILGFYTTHVLPSKSAVPPQASFALKDFFASHLTDDDVAKSLRPTMEKLLIRSPEVSLPIEDAFFQCYAHDTSPHVKPLLTGIISASRSSVPATRAKAISLFVTLISFVQDEKALKEAAEEIVALLKTAGKTSSPDQRAALYEMLAAFPESLGPVASSSIAESIATLLPKETTEASLRGALLAVMRRLYALLSSPSNGANHAALTLVGKAVAKELQNAKVPLRKVACSIVGSSIWELKTGADSTALAAFGEALLPAFEANLKNATTSTLTSPSGPLEGFVAVALVESPLKEVQKISDFAAKNEVLKGLLVTASPKPSFLLWDKVHRKFTAEDEQTWLLRALHSVWLHRATEMAGDEGARKASAHALIQAALTSEHTKVRRQAVDVVKGCAASHPVLIATIVKNGILAWVHEQRQSTAANAVSDEAPAKKNPHAQSLKALLLAASSLRSETTSDVKQEVLSSLLLCSHLPELNDSQHATFASLCMQTQVKASQVVEDHLMPMLQICREGLADSVLQSAALASVTTLAMHAPESVIAELVGDIEASVDGKALRALTEQELGILATAPDVTFVDVLAETKPANIDKNRKDAKTEQWEAELRAELAKKKAAESKTLTKEQKSKVDAQLKVEAEIRAQVAALQSALRRGMQIIVALVAAKSEELDSYLPSLVRIVRELLQIPQARQLDRSGLLAAFSALCSCASSRLAEAKLFLQVVLLRTISDDLVAEDFRGETLRDQLLRVLYRLRFLSEQEPLSLASIAVVVPLLSLIVAKEGIDTASGVSEEVGEGETSVADNVLEQIQLALEIIDFHAGSCEDVRFPRSEMIDDLVAIVKKHSRLARDAVGALRSMGEAIKDSALPIEISKLLSHTLAQETYVRLGALQAIQSLDLSELEYSSELWLACHDPLDTENARLALKAWEDNGLDVPEEFGSTLIPYLEDDRAYVRRAAGQALAGAVELHPEALPTLLTSLYKLYEERNRILTAEYDQFGMIIESTRNREDPWRIRTAIAHAFGDLAPQLQATDLEPFFEFMIKDEALGDRNDDVRQNMLDAASSVVDLHGKERLSELITRFESFLAKPPPPSEALDGVLEAVVILLGRLARHLSATDKRISSIVERLLDALKTPSEMVQVAVADCLPALVPAIKGDVPRLVERLFTDLLQGAKYAHRRGAAYGLAGIIKGRGISAVAEFGVMSKLTQAIEDKSSVNARQSAVECYGIMAAILRRLFEPYIIEGGVLHQLIASFGDSKAEVRDATEETAKVMMANVSAFCAKLMLPTLLEGLEEKQWRTKKGAIELLGAYSSAAPAQLAAALPTVIPRLSGVLSDAHPQVRAAGNRSLKQFGLVMKNPEIKSMVPALLQALVDPTSKTAPALHKLLTQTFAHYLDAPSLALVVPIVDRGLRDRSAQVQRDGAKIMGNLASLTDGKDLRGHLPRLMPLIREVLVSPVPETRAEAARALGVMVERLGEVQFPDLVPSLMAQLRGADVTGVDRQGAAQGLSEVLAALGMDRLEALLPSVLDNTSSPQAHVREGGIALLIYLPGTFGAVRFGPYVSRIITPILNGLADVSDSVREMSMRAGRMIIGSFSKDAVDLLLPELEQSMFDDTPRIRQSSLSLCSELLFRLGGISGKNTLAAEADEGGEGEDGEVPEQSVVVSNSVQSRLKNVLGEERFVRTMATIFCLRQDPAFNVREAASGSWKAIIVNTAKTIRELLPMIIDLIIRSLSRDGEDQREIASRTLGEITRKLGGSVLEEIVPQLQQRGSDAGASAAVRAGVMLAVESLLENATEAQLEDHEDALIAATRQGLTDRSPAVREAAASAFDALQETVGQRAIEEVIPVLLGALQNRKDSGGDDSMAETSLAALREVMRTRADTVFPASLPTLLVQPISAFNARALGNLVAVAGNAINRRLSQILGALATAMDAEEDEDTREALQEAVDAVLKAVNNFEALHQLMMLLLSWVGDAADKEKRKVLHGCRYYSKFASDLSERGGARALEGYNKDWLRRLATLLDSREPDVVDACLPALAACVEAMEDPEELVIPLRHTLSGLSDEVPGLAKKEGFGACSGVFLAGLLSGTGEQKEQAAVGLGILVMKADPVAIKPFVTTGLAGPLIRACGERHAAQVKAAILNTLDTCLKRIPQHLKPFYPQLSRSFLKAVGDPTGLAVRNSASVCLGTLSTISGARLDLNALITGARSGIRGEEETTDYPDGSASGLAQVLLRSELGNAQVDAVKGDVASLIESAFSPGCDEERFKSSMADVLSGFTRHDPAAARSLVVAHVLPAATDSTLASLCLASLLENVHELAYDFGHAEKMAHIVKEFCVAGPGIARPAREAREWMKTRNPWASDEGVMGAF
ncbi:ARM repeat-containing protein [Jaminaea rosea]|uniref:ARM repeat-containing protein n=1 Tax=Jaminaea rosea TaxID=1569628 RepID=A0A316UUE9_9BASI|nr:ARM repeat-containing protein [Jaminaea rosea]PWN28930.1 ARM repeat-containing protein [Jaminaea rosea]